MKTSYSFFAALLLFSVIFTSSTFAADLDCTPIFNGLPRSPYPCARAVDAKFPRVVSGIPVDFYHYTVGYSGDVGQKQLIRLASIAIDESIPVLLKYGALPPLNFIFINEIEDHAVAAAGWHDVPAGKACGIQLYFNVDTKFDEFKQVVAHEIAHCFQAKNIFVPEMPEDYSAKWWVEGFAEYLSSVVYPYANREWYPERVFNPALPLFTQSSAYKNSLFFKYMNQTGSSIQSIVQNLKTHPQLNDLPQEYSAFSNWASIADRFHEFALAIDNRTITDSGSPQPLPSYTAETFKLSSTEKEQKLSGKSVAAHLVKIKIPQAGIWKIQWKGTSATRVSYRSPGMQWEKLEQFTEISFDLDCGSAGTTFDVLWTSTDPQPDSELTLMVEASPKDCRCVDTSSVLDSCLKGKWKLNVTKSNEALRQYFADHPSADGSTGDLSFYGDQILNLQEGHSSSVYTFMNYGSNLRFDVPTGQMVIKTEINGTMNSTFTTNKTGRICAKDESANATVQTWNDGQDQGILPYEIYQADPTPMKFTCDSSQLQLSFDTTDPTFPVYLQQILIFDRVSK